MEKKEEEKEEDEEEERDDESLGCVEILKQSEDSSESRVF